jgi:cystathionine gamma-synthase
MSDAEPNPRHLLTRVVAAGRPAREPDAPLNAPIVPVSALHAGGPYEYAREGAPTTAAFEEALGEVEGGIAIAFASGMAAANAVFDTWPGGVTVVAPSAAYTGVAVRLRELDERGAINLRIVDAHDTKGVLAALDGAHTLWMESPTNPMLDVAELEVVIPEARRKGVRTVVDNTFATPIIQRPLEWGADIVLHSVTKSISGHSDLLMGALVTQDEEMAEKLRVRRVLLGAAPSAFDCYLALRGLRTLGLRVERAQANAIAITQAISAHPAIAKVRYPGFGTMAAIEVVGGAEAAERVCESVQVWTYATSLGGVESLLERRRRWPLESPRVPESLIRLSFGIEYESDLLADLQQALDRSQS